MADGPNLDDDRADEIDGLRRKLANLAGFTHGADVWRPEVVIWSPFRFFLTSCFGAGGDPS
jgi:hypothetical protein